MQGKLAAKTWGQVNEHICEIIGVSYNKVTIQTKSDETAKALGLHRYDFSTFRGEISWSSRFRAWTERYTAKVGDKEFPIAFFDDTRVLLYSPVELAGFWQIGPGIWVRWVPTDRVDKLEKKETMLEGLPSHWFQSEI